MRLAFLACVVLIALSAPGRIAAQDAPPEGDAAYRSTVEEAVREFGAGRFEEARALFKRAHELSPNARTLRGLGMTAFELRAYVQAIRELTAALEDKRKPLEGELRTKVQALLEKSRKFVGVVRIELEPKDAALLVDGKSPVFEPNGTLLLDAGTHVFSATAPKHKATNMRLLIEGDSEQTVKMPLESTEFQQSMIAPIDAEQVASQKDEPAVTESTEQRAEVDDGGSAAQTWAIATLIGAGAFGATATVFWFVGDSQYKDLEDTCAPGCSGAQVDDSGLKTSDLLTNVFLGLSAASLATSGILFVIASGETDEAPMGGTALHITPLGARVSGSF